jgi:hypothetical protein
MFDPVIAHSREFFKMFKNFKNTKQMKSQTLGPMYRVDP